MAVLSLGLLLAASGAGAEDLDQIIPGLYGGNGITLRATCLPSGNPPPCTDPTQVDHQGHFTQESLKELSSLSSGISSGVNLGNVGASTSSFTFDTQQAVFVNSTDSLGPTYAERAETIGKGKLNIAFAYTRLDYKKLGGKNLDSYWLKFPHEDDCNDPFGQPASAPSGCVSNQVNPELPAYETDDVLVNLNIDLSQDQFLFYGKYGITSNWDVGLVIPVIHSELSVRSTAEIVRNFQPSTQTKPNEASTKAHSFCLNGTDTGCVPNPPDFDPDISTLGSPDRTADSGSGDYTGVGDILLRTKYQFFRDHPVVPDLAVLGGVRFASGDENNFAGAGNTGFQGYLLASKKFGMFVPHFNWGTELTTDSGDTNIWRLAAGSEFSPIRQLTLSADVVGQQSWNGDGVSARIWDVGVGAKINPWNALNLIVGFLVPINKDYGLRTDFSYTLGLEYTFF